MRKEELVSYYNNNNSNLRASLQFKSQKLVHQVRVKVAQLKVHNLTYFLCFSPC